MQTSNALYNVSSQASLSSTSGFNDSVGGAMIWIVIGIFLIFIVKFVLIYLEERGLGRFKKNRKSLKGMRELAIKQKLEAEIMLKSKPSARYKYEKMAAQAGIKFSYGEYRLICFVCAIVLSLLVFLFMDNTMLAFAMIFFGWFLPTQAISSIRNRRIRILERQVESFMELFVERYKLTQSPSIALEGCAQDLAGQQPLYSELQQAISEMDTGDPVLEAFQRLAERTANKYLIRMSTSLRMAEDIGTSDAREMLLTKALQQYRNNKTLRNTLKERIEGPKRESMILLFAVPGVILYQCFTSDSYIDFMLNDQIGKYGCVFIILSCLGCVWFINKKIGAPIE